MGSELRVQVSLDRKSQGRPDCEHGGCGGRRGEERKRVRMEPSGARRQGGLPMETEREGMDTGQTGEEERQSAPGERP